MEVIEVIERARRAVASGVPARLGTTGVYMNQETRRLEECDGTGCCLIGLAALGLKVPIDIKVDEDLLTTDDILDILGIPEELGHYLVIGFDGTGLAKLEAKVLDRGGVELTFYKIGIWMAKEFGVVAHNMED